MIGRSVEVWLGQWVRAVVIAEDGPTVSVRTAHGHEWTVDRALVRG